MGAPAQHLRLRRRTGRCTPHGVSDGHRQDFSGALRLIKFHQKRPRDPPLLHSHPVDRIGRRDGALVVGDNDKLRLFHELLQQIGESVNI